MAIGGTLLIILIAVALIWVFVEIKRFKHKLFAILLIVLIVFSYLSFTATIKGKDLDLKSIDGIREAGSSYLYWLGNVFTNIKTITSNAISLDWKSKETKNNLEKNKTKERWWQ